MTGKRPDVAPTVTDTTAEAIPFGAMVPARCGCCPAGSAATPRQPRSGENTAAALLLAVTVVAIVWANSPWAHSYTDVLEHADRPELRRPTCRAHRQAPRQRRADDVLLLHRRAGGEEPSSPSANSPTARAPRCRCSRPSPGSILPAVVFLLFNPRGDDARAWGVVISTDTAFLVGALAIIGPEVPCAAADLPAHPGGRRRRRCAAGDRAVLLRHVRIVPLLIAAVLIAAIALVRYLPAGRGAGLRACWRSHCGWRCPSAACTRRWPAWRWRC